MLGPELCQREGSNSGWYGAVKPKTKENLGRQAEIQEDRGELVLVSHYLQATSITGVTSRSSWLPFALELDMHVADLEDGRMRNGKGRTGLSVACWSVSQELYPGAQAFQHPTWLSEHWKDDSCCFWSFSCISQSALGPSSQVGMGGLGDTVPA